MNNYEELIKQGLAKTTQAQAILAEFESKDLPAEKAAEFDKLMSEADSLKQRAERIKLVLERDAELQKQAAAIVAQKQAAEQIVTESKAATAAYQMRYGSDDEAKRVIMSELLGADYRDRIDHQNKAFIRYLRYGEKAIDPADWQALKQQILPWDQVEYLIKTGGLSVAEVKTTMVEAQGMLGGYAVPPNVQQAILSRLPGLTAVRGGGARVVQLTNGNATEVPYFTGGDDRYATALRGVWGYETATPTAKNATLGMIPVVAQVYTYKVVMSQSLVEDAGNLIDLVQAAITDTLAIDEDEAFLIGDGANKPLGLLPSSANGNSLSTVNTGDADYLTADGVKGLKRGVASQYRRNAVWVGNSDTFGDIEVLKAGTGDYLFPDMSDDDMLLNRRIFESEAMPDVAASAYPLLFGDMTGYWIVEKFGLTIQRMQDSGTGPNVVEYHVRRRVGGRPVELWKFVAAYVSA